MDKQLKDYYDILSKIKYLSLHDWDIETGISNGVVSYFEFNLEYK